MNPNSSSIHPGLRSFHGFTLIELMAVLTVLTLLLWLSADGALERRKRTHRQAEQAELARLSEAWILTLLRFRTLPSTTNWVDWLAAGSSLPGSRIARNGSGVLRQLVYDPAARFGSPLDSCPFTQGISGSLKPLGPRLLIVSSLGGELPDLRTLSFDALWAAPPGVRPSGWPSDWTGEPEDLLVERMDLRSRFQRVVLHNVDADADATYAVVRQSASLSPAGRLEGWFLTGTSLELKSVDGSTQVSGLIQQDCSYVFERRRWRRQVFDGPARAGGVGDVADRFLSASFPPGGGRSAAEQAVVVDELVGFLNAYANWGVQGFPVGGGSGTASHPLHRTAVETQARLRDFAHQLIQP